MKRQIVFLVHGVGDQKAGWTKSFIKELDEIGKRYSTVEEKPSKQIEFVEIAYGDIFDKQLDRWDKDVDQLKADGVIPQAADALAWLDNTTAGGFVWTHVGDVVLFCSRLTRMAAVSEVVAQMAKVIAAENDAQTEFSIVAHSLGTAVTMEAVNALATPAADIGWTGLPKKFMFREIIMVSNTSRLLQRAGLAAYTDSNLLPARFKKGGLCVTYRNIFHRRDPVSWVRRFDLQALEDTGYLPFAVDHYYARNIHGLSHYLEHPAVHGPLLRLPRAANLPAKAFALAVKEYHDDAAKRFGGAFSKPAQVDAFIGEIRQDHKPDPESENQLVAQLKYIADVLRRML